MVIEPAMARLEGARWRVSGGGWHESGETLALTPGEYMVLFEDIDCGVWGCFKPWLGWNPPDDISVGITSGETNTVTGTYTLVDKFSTATSTSRKAAGDLLLAAIVAASLLRSRSRGIRRNG